MCRILKKKKKNSKLIYKRETDSQTSTIISWLPKGKGRGWMN